MRHRVESLDVLVYGYSVRECVDEIFVLVLGWKQTIWDCD